MVVVWFGFSCKSCFRLFWVVGWVVAIKVIKKIQNKNTPKDNLLRFRYVITVFFSLVFFCNIIFFVEIIVY